MKNHGYSVFFWCFHCHGIILLYVSCANNDHIFTGISGAINDSACEYVKSLNQRRVFVTVTGQSDNRVICQLITGEDESVSDNVKTLMQSGNVKLLG